MCLNMHFTFCIYGPDSTQCSHFINDFHITSIYNLTPLNVMHTLKSDHSDNFQWLWELWVHNAQPLYLLFDFRKRLRCGSCNFLILGCLLFLFFALFACNEMSQRIQIFIHWNGSAGVWNVSEQHDWLLIVFIYQWLNEKPLYWNQKTRRP